MKIQVVALPLLLFLGLVDKAVAENVYLHCHVFLADGKDDGQFDLEINDESVSKNGSRYVDLQSVAINPKRITFYVSDRGGTEGFKIDRIKGDLTEFFTNADNKTTTKHGYCVKN